MKIYLMQHGLAVSESENPERPLSAAGQDQIQTSAGAIRKMGLRFDVIIASTKKRSKQTAEIVAGCLGYPLEQIVESESVNPLALPEDAVETIARFKDKNTILVVGHLPSLGKIASSLLFEADRVGIHFENGGLCCIEVPALPAHSGSLQFCLTHEQMGMIAG